MEKIMLSDSYQLRQETETTFTRECNALAAAIKEKYRESRAISIAVSPLYVRGYQLSFLYCFIAILNMETHSCVFLQVECNASIYYWELDKIRTEYRNAEQLLKMRFDESHQPSPMKGITLEEIFSNCPFGILETRKAEITA